MLMRSTTAVLCAALLAAPMAHAQSAATAANPAVGGAEMMTTMNIVENAANSPIHTTLVAAVQAAGLVETLQGEGPFTVFAPTDEAFAGLPAGTVDTLLMEENMAQLQQVLTGHVVAGSLSGAELMARVEASPDGFYHFNAVSGDALSAKMQGGSLYVFDENGTASRVTIADVNQSNGVIHVVDQVLVPRM